MAEAWDQFETLLTEYISPSVTDLILDDDDVAWNLIGMFQPETIGGRRQALSTTDLSPAGYEARFEIKVARGGRVSSGRFTGNTPQMMGKDSHLMMGQAANAKFLDPRHTPQRAWIEINMRLKRILGSVTVNHQQITAELMAKPVEEIVGDEMSDAVFRYRNFLMNMFYGDGTGTLAQVNNGAGYNITEAAGGVEVTIDNGSFARFAIGDRLVAGSDADPRVQRTGNISGAMRIVNVDVDTRKIWLQSEPGEGTIALSDNDHLMYEGTYDFTAATVAAGALVPQGVGNLIRSSGVFPGSISAKYPSGLDVAHHNVLKGFVQTDATLIDPTMDAFTLILDKMRDAGIPLPPVMIGERSLWTFYNQLERDAVAYTPVPMGQIFQASGGVAGPVLGHNEYRPTRMDSARIVPNSVLGLSPSTWRKYMPMGDRTIHWKYGNGPLSGISSIFGPVYEGPQLTELSDAPFEGYAEFGLINPRANFRRVGLKTQRDV